MTVRDPGYDPRHGDSAAGTATRRGVGGILPIALLVGAVLLAGLWIGSMLAAGSGSPAPTGPGAVALATGSPTAPDASAPVATAESGSDTGSSDEPSAEPAPPIAVSTTTSDVAIVPVINFRSTRSSMAKSDVVAIVDGSSSIKKLVLVDGDADATLKALGLERADLGSHLVTVGDADALASYLAGHRSTAGFLRADEVGPSVRALSWGSKSLFGVDRVGKLSAWPLTARLEVPEGASPAFDPKTAWTLVAGGDILLDRGVALAIKGSKRGSKFPFDGGTVEITGRCKDCSAFGWDLPYTRRTGNAGAVRSLVSSADLAIANFENPAPKGYRFHASGTVFSANPAFIKGVKNAGFDWVSLANNHIGDAGRTGILQTMSALDTYGIAHGGAGADSGDAHTATLLRVGGLTVGILGYDTIAAYYTAGDSTAGSARMTKKALKADIKAARKAGADVVIVFPHWGIEYRAAPTDRQRSLGHAAINAGADLVIGNHPHWAEGMEIYKGKPIWYALGNLVFDQTWSEPTMEGLTLELTFEGKRLVQIHMRSHLILDRAQPNFMDPAGSGKVVMKQVWGASKGLLPW